MAFSPEYDSLIASVKSLFAEGSFGFTFTLEANAPDFRATNGRANIQEAVFALGAQTFTYRMGIKVPWEFRWKGDEPGCEIRIKTASRCDPVAFDGPWALFKVFDAAQAGSGRVYWDFPCGFTYRAEYGLKGDFLGRGHFRSLRLPERLCQ
jgi:type VI protein secretion system component VasK